MSVASDFAGLYQWLVADSGGYNDQSGNGHHATAGPPAPTIQGGVANGHDAFFFDGTTSLNLGDLSALSQGELFIAIAVVNDPPTVEKMTGIGKFGTSGAIDLWPYFDSNVYIGFGSNNRYSCGNPEILLNTEIRILNVRSATNDWALLIDGGVLASSTSNTPAWTNAATLGRSAAAYFLQGYIPEYALFTSPLSPTDRADLTASLMAKYQGNYRPPGGSAAARVTATGLSVLSDVDTPSPHARVTAIGLSVLMLPGDAVVGGASRSRCYLID